MRRLGITLAAALIAAASVSSAMAETVKLPAPDLSMTVPLMTALQNRHSERKFAGSELSPRELSGLLWSSLGVNREDGKRVAPSSLNRQEVEAYVLTKKGAWRYDAKAHALVQVSDKPLLALAAGTPERNQPYVLTAAAALIYTADTSKLPAGRALQNASIDSGLAAQGALLYCSAAGLACVPRTTMDGKALAEALGLAGERQPVMNIIAGHRAP